MQQGRTLHAFVPHRETSFQDSSDRHSVSATAECGISVARQKIDAPALTSPRKEEEVFMKFKFVLALVSLPLLIATSASSQSTDFVEAAKKEGAKVVVYGSLESDTMDAVAQAFQKKTGIEVNYWRGSATKVIDRALSEYRAGRPLFDVILTNSDPMHILEKDGIFAKYDSASAKEFPQSAVDPNLGPRYRNVIIGIVYNKSLINPADAPKSLEDLLKPQYKGKLVMPDPTQHTTTAQWLASLYKVMGREKAQKFIEGLAASQPILVESFLPAAKRVTTGETPIAITYIKYAYIFGKEGAPLDYVRLPIMLGDGHYIALSNKAPHPDAGKAFIDFFLGRESMNIMANMGEFVNRKGVYPPLPDADKIQFAQMDDFSSKGYAQLKTEYAKLFLR
jgi:iron(III) transport system substrate-binding protein